MLEDNCGSEATHSGRSREDWFTSIDREDVA